jgi:hypothetical protein
MPKVVINDCYGGFGLSKAAYEELGIPWDGYGYDYDSYDKRTDPKLIEVVEKLGEKANGSLAHLTIIEIPDDVEYTIENYDGMEHVAEVHRTWY